MDINNKKNTLLAEGGGSSSSTNKEVPVAPAESPTTPTTTKTPIVPVIKTEPLKPTGSQTSQSGNQFAQNEDIYAVPDAPSSIRPDEWNNTKKNPPGIPGKKTNIGNQDFDENQFRNLLNTPQHEQDADEMAKHQFEQDAASVEQSQLQSRQNIEKNANQANVDYSMLSYQQNQNIEKMGWSGGSYLDAKSQQDYLAASIQADLYGQIELQRYGYEVEMAKARAAFAANQKQLAMQYLKDAYEVAFTTTQQTGIWIDPTVKDRLQQWDVAKKMMEEYAGDMEGEEYKKAKAVRLQILASFGINTKTPLSEAGVDVLYSFLESQNLYSNKTLSSEQIKDMQVTTENAADLAQREREKQDEEKYIYHYTNSNGERVSVNMLSTKEGDLEGIKQVLSDRPELYYTIISSFTDKARAEYEVWKQEPGNEEKSFDKFLLANKGTRDAYFKQAFVFAQTTGNSKFVFNGKTYYTSQVGSGEITKQEDGTYVDEDGNLVDDEGYLLDDNGNRVDVETPVEQPNDTTIYGEWKEVKNDNGKIVGITHNNQEYNIVSPDEFKVTSSSKILKRRLEEAGLINADSKSPVNYPSVMETKDDIDYFLELFRGPYKEIIDNYPLNGIKNSNIIERRNQSAFLLLGIDTSGLVTLTGANDEQERAIVANFGGAKQIYALIEWKKTVKESAVTDPVERKVWWLADWFQKQERRLDLNR